MKVIKCNKCGRFFRVLDNSYELQKCTGCGSSNLHEIIYSLNGDNIDWEQRRYEIAKEAMIGIIANSHDDDYRYVERGHSQNYKYKLEKTDIAYRAVLYADALITELKDK